MLRIGLSGGIGSGKSTVARRWVEHGAVLIDADVIAREVVAPGSDGLAAVVERFGEGVLDEHGALNRSAMAERVFADDSARTELNGIVHPRIARRTADLMAAAPEDAIVVHDIPLLVELGYAADYHLVVIVDADEELRVRRLVERGLGESDARARIRSQASEQRRREAADVWLDNSGPADDLRAEVDRLWTRRLVPFESNVRLRQLPNRGPARIVEHDPDWPRQAARLAARLSKAAGERALRVDHIGSTSVPDLAARDLLDFQLTVRSMEDADALEQPLSDAGFPVRPDIDVDHPRPDASGPHEWIKRFHVSADPERFANLHVRVAGRANWRYGLLFPAWLRADPRARAEYERLKRETAARFVSDARADRYAEAKNPWFCEALPLAEQWARETGWQPPEV
ncbi:dephospho-CoA kinase [Saccharopolyspora lacisalsi]|uniref:Dephospho-CoA kinase n=1 Tax=Halosaccharopolyspora lacisalsi TaxID=1000566 RepID=A0A839DVE0_9PSEU|nr:dephospho-CoA kinase [Halosaccharopolyspora lacisalsi]MBA8825942.1 dephospho-CoA kinase [Halosaccharopolyspora lacisalsi]